jgi:hypothetical protein
MQPVAGIDPLRAVTNGSFQESKSVVRIDIKGHIRRPQLTEGITAN